MALKKSQRSLQAWTKQKWRTKSGKPSTKVQKQQVSVTYQQKRSKHYPQKNMRRLQQLKEKDLSRENNSLNSLRLLQKKSEHIGK